MSDTPRVINGDRISNIRDCLAYSRAAAQATDLSDGPGIIIIKVSVGPADDAGEDALDIFRDKIKL